MASFNLNRDIKAGDFRTKINIERKQAGEVDEYGLVEDSWVVISTPFSKKTVKSVKEQNEASGVSTTYEVEVSRFWIRTNPRLKLQLTDRINLNGVLYNITSLNDYEERQRITEIVAQKVV